MTRRIVVLCMMTCLFTVCTASAVPLYSIHDLGTMGKSRAVASAINNNGVVVGTVDSSGGAYRWEKGQVTFLPFLNESLPFAGALAINDKNEIAGYSTQFNWHHAVMWDSNANISDLGRAGSHGMDINNASQVIARDWSMEGSRLWDNGQVTMIVDYNTVERSAPYGINDSGQVVGRAYKDGDFSYLWENGNFYNLKDLVTSDFSGELTDVVDINNNGQILGDSWLFEDGNVLDLGFSEASAINELGQIVGGSYLFEGGQLYDLNEFIQSDVLYSQLSANDINELGQIVGQFEVNGETHAFLLDPVPVPEPASVILLASGLACLAGIRRRRKARFDIMDQIHPGGESKI